MTQPENLKAVRKAINKFKGNDLDMEVDYCKVINDHSPLWDGQAYTCLFCGREFMTAEQAKIRILALLVARDEQEKG